ncbi:MAG: hypothetical protein R3362_03985 [Rhodothermales bacterium]|nr:hypothetical protein [Rhodothermales bacterium]
MAAGRPRLAEQKLVALAEACRPAAKQAREVEGAWGFNEWVQAQTGEPAGQDWQTWSAALFLYAAACVERRRTPFFHGIRQPERTDA